MKKSSQIFLAIQSADVLSERLFSSVTQNIPERKAAAFYKNMWSIVFIKHWIIQRDMEIYIREDTGKQKTDMTAKKIAKDWKKVESLATSRTRKREREFLSKETYAIFNSQDKYKNKFQRYSEFLIGQQMNHTKKLYKPQWSEYMWVLKMLYI